MQLLLGKPVADAMQARLEEKTLKLKSQGITPKLAIIRVGERPDDIAYEKGAMKKMESIGIEIDHTLLDIECSQAKLETLIIEKNNSEDIHGILLFRPLPKHLDENKIIKLIKPSKDVDCMNLETLAGVFEVNESTKLPCTPQAVIEILKHYDIALEGKNVVVLGRSTVIGKPVAMLMLNENATVTICHSKTKDMKAITQNADILISAIGKAKMVDESYIKEGAVVIDVGINIDEDGKLCGDVDFEAVEGKVSAITPVPRGVGSVTTTMLAQNLLMGI